MSVLQWFGGLLKVEEMAHRPPPRYRWWFYGAAAFLIPVVIQVVFPEDPTYLDELVWLVTLTPAFLLALHYGLKGAFVALILGTGLFVVVQLVVALNFTPDDWRITVPTYIAYGALAISVGWLSEQLHEHYLRALGAERMAAIGQLSVAINHEVNNALTAIVTESQMLLEGSGDLTAEQKESAVSIRDAALRVAKDIEKITKLQDAPVTTYVGDTQMIDLRSAKTD